MHQATVITKDGLILHFLPRFVPHDAETRNFAHTASVAMENCGVSIAIGDEPNIQALDIAIQVLQGARENQIQSEELYGRIEKE